MTFPAQAAAGPALRERESAWRERGLARRGDPVFTAPAPPPLRLEIGRIDFDLRPPQQPATQRARPARPQPRLSLGQYLSRYGTALPAPARRGAAR